MTGILVAAALWQVVLVGLWGLFRRVRRLERNTFRPPCYAQVAALRRNVAGLRGELADVDDEQTQWTGNITRSVMRAEEEIRAVSGRIDHLSLLVLHQMEQIEKHFGGEGTDLATHLPPPPTEP
jgi:hypothetical protein